MPHRTALHLFRVAPRAPYVGSSEPTLHPQPLVPQTALPYVEVYRGKTLLESNTIPPSQLELLTQALGKAIESVEREVGSRWRQERQKLWALLQVRRAHPSPMSTGAISIVSCLRAAANCLRSSACGAATTRGGAARRAARGITAEQRRSIRVVQGGRVQATRRAKKAAATRCTITRVDGAARQARLQLIGGEPACCCYVLWCLCV